MNAEPEFMVNSNHGTAECWSCERAAGWAVLQVQIMGVQEGRDRVMDARGEVHEATARHIENEG